ncbi:MAG: hypothetical protein WD969_12985 [Paracoccaceae bacterium]
MSDDTANLRRMLKAEFGLTGRQASRIADHLNDIIDEEDGWEPDYFGPDDARKPYTEFDPSTGLPIVHSRKVRNYTVNLKRIYKNPALHETVLDAVEDLLSVHRLLYRMARFLIAESKITLGEHESAVYFLLWKHDVTPVDTSKGYEKISRYLKNEFGEHITESRYQSCLDELDAAGLISITGDVIRIIEHPKASHSRKFK